MTATAERLNEFITLYEGDCLDVLPTLGKVDAVVTDPPYGIGYSSGHGSKVWGDGSVEGDADTSSRDLMLQTVAKWNVPVLCFGSWRVPRPANTKALLVWDTLGALGMGDLRIPWKPSHQEIYVLGNVSGLCGERDSDVIRHPPVQSMAKNGRQHPMEKPVGLLQLLIRKTNAKTILDPFAGSGTTAIAAMKEKRRCILIEKDPEYCEIIRRRVREADGVGEGSLFAFAGRETQMTMGWK